MVASVYLSYRDVFAAPPEPEPEPELERSETDA
jgi:hypothetical protein